MSMSRSYPVPVETTRCESNVKGSRFIATAERVRNPDEASAFVNAVKREFPDASHNCFAYVAGAPGDTNRVGMSDDGEPSGTAGRPMLSSLLHSGVGEIAVVVTRYFGGTKLGKGGLVRAYTQAVQDVLNDLPVEQLRNWTKYCLCFAYPELDKTKMLIDKFDGELDAVDYGAEVRMKVRVPEDVAEAFREGFVQATSGRGNIEAAGEA